MNNTAQQDLFQTSFISGGEKTIRQEPPPPVVFLERFRFSIRLDQVLVILIGMLLVCAVVFSLGFEKGRQMGAAKLRAEREKISRLQSELTKNEEKLKSLKPLEVLPIDALPSVVQKQAENGVSESQAAVMSAVKAVEAGQQPSSARFTIQLVTYKTKVVAEKKVQELQAKGLVSFVAKLGDFFLVCIDRFETQKEAQKSLSQLKAQKIVPSDAYVRSMPANVLKV